MSTGKKTILKEAITDYNEIMEAATIKAKDELAIKFPDNFSNLLKEELENKKIVKESYKKVSENKINESTNTNEPDMATKKVTTVKKVVNEGNENQPFNSSAPKVQNEEFNISELDLDSTTTALNNADDTDEVITMDEIEKEIASMGAEPVTENKDALSHTESPSIIDKSVQDGTSYGKLVSLRNQLDEMIGGMDDEKFNIDKVGQSSTEEIQENQEELISDEDIDTVLNTSAPNEVDEVHGVTHATQRNVTATIPRNDYVSTSELNRRRDAVQESQKKISSLIKENMRLTKKINEAKKIQDTTGGLLENYKTALGKYRVQLKEMALFNTNLAYTNNLLVNEELALTQDDKVKIINEFKSIDNIAASGEKYKKILTEMKGNKKTITESIESKVATSVGTSSKQILDEVVEKTAYSDNAHINKIKKLMHYAEARAKK